MLCEWKPPTASDRAREHSHVWRLAYWPRCAVRVCVRACVRTYVRVLLVVYVCVARGCVQSPKFCTFKILSWAFEGKLFLNIYAAIERNRDITIYGDIQARHSWKPCPDIPIDIIIASQSNISNTTWSHHIWSKTSW